MLHVVKRIDRRFGAGSGPIVLGLLLASLLALGVGLLLLAGR